MGVYNTYLDKLHGQFPGEVTMEVVPKNHAGINFGKSRVTWNTAETIPQQSDNAVLSTIPYRMCS